jgi:hypothetical protein
VGFVVDKVALDQFFSLSTSVFPYGIIWPVLCIQSVIHHCCCVVSAVDSVVK